MMGVTSELAYFKRAAEASSTYAGAAASAHASLRRLRRLYRQGLASFTPRVIAQLRQLAERLPAWAPTVVCPTCQGSGTMRWLIHKHACTRCGGWRRVAKTAEAARENAWIWGKASAGCQE